MCVGTWLVRRSGDLPLAAEVGKGEDHSRWALVGGMGVVIGVYIGGEVRRNMAGT